MPYRKTPVAARELGINYHRIIFLIRHRRLDPMPEQDSSGDYIWTDADLERARQALRDIAGRKKQKALPVA